MHTDRFLILVISQSTQLYVLLTYGIIFPTQTLVDKLCSQLDDESLKLRSKVLSLSYYNDEISHKWSISYSSHLDNQKQQFLDQSFDAVIMTVKIPHMNCESSEALPYILFNILESN